MKLKQLPARIAVLKPQGPKVLTQADSSWRAGKTSTERGYGYKWQQARAQYLEANPLCVYCEAEGQATPANVVDHKIPHEGDQKLFWDRKNWQSLCTPCHSSKKQAEEKRNRSGAAA